MLYKKEPIIGYEEYQIDTDGNVYNKNGTLKVVSKNKRGYYIVTFCINGKLKYFSVHVLVARQFIPNPENLPQVNHKDENKLNNKTDNLEWCTHTYNNNYGTKNKRTADKLSKQIKCLETGIIYQGFHEAGRQTGIDYRSINDCCRGRYGHKTAGGYHWEYAQ